MLRMPGDRETGSPGVDAGDTCRGDVARGAGVKWEGSGKKMCLGECEKSPGIGREYQVSCRVCGDDLQKAVYLT